MERSETLLDAISTIWKWRKSILLITVSAFVISCIVSLLLPNYYKASTLFYAASPDLAKPVPVGNSDLDVEYYGTDTDLDRLFSIANSQVVMDHLIVSHNLYDHYQINRNNPKATYKIHKKLSKLYKTVKTKYDALELSVEDKVPETAASLANEARAQINELAQALIKESQKKTLDVLNRSLQEKETQLHILNDSLANIREQYGIYDLVTQGEILVEQKTRSMANLNGARAKLKALGQQSVMPDSIFYLKALVAGFLAQVDQIEIDLKDFNSGYNTIFVLERERLELTNQLNLDNERKKQLDAAYQSDFPSLHVVEAATIPVHKSKPRRSIYVLISTLFTFVLSSLAVLSIEAGKSVKWKEVFNQ